MNEKPGSRLFYLDNLRIYLTILVILHHAAIAYGGNGDWAVKDPGVGRGCAAGQEAACHTNPG